MSDEEMSPGEQLIAVVEPKLQGMSDNIEALGQGVTNLRVEVGTLKGRSNGLYLMIGLAMTLVLAVGGYGINKTDAVQINLGGRIDRLSDSLNKRVDDQTVRMDNLFNQYAHLDKNVALIFQNVEGLEDKIEAIRTGVDDIRKKAANDSGDEGAWVRESLTQIDEKIDELDVLVEKAGTPKVPDG